MTLELTDAPARPPETARARDFADAMSALAGGVSIVTCRLDGRPWGMTVTAFASVSADPPTVLVSLAANAASACAIAETERFGVSILGERQPEIARRCSAPGAPKFLERFVDPGEAPSPTPMVAGALAHLDCEVVERIEVADHTVLFGRVRQARVGRGGAPLVYFRRAYRALAARHGAHDHEGGAR
jgi:flavin reductase (DIM6/NTAB) family NADH-FMN oxidoreductase RutF